MFVRGTTECPTQENVFFPFLGLPGLQFYQTDVPGVEKGNGYDPIGSLNTLHGVKLL